MITLKVKTCKDGDERILSLSKKILQSQVTGPLPTAEYVDLSSQSLINVEKLSECPKVLTLILRGNKLQDITGIENCTQVWHLDLGNNHLKSLYELNRFLALGTLILSNNQLSWADVADCRHLHLMIVSLHGNPLLEKDPYYRLHVIDCLPNMWLLDGRSVTSIERLRVKHFFRDSALGSHPVRKKPRRMEVFVPSAVKKLQVDGIFGKKATELLMLFPHNAVLNIEMDWKRFHLLVKHIQDDINLEWASVEKWEGADPVTMNEKKDHYLKHRNMLTDLFTYLENYTEKCNMLLMLLLASLNFLLPTSLVVDTLEKLALLQLGKLHTMNLFLLPRNMRCKVVSLLFAVVKLKREENKGRSVYQKLFLCLMRLVEEVTYRTECPNDSEQGPSFKRHSQEWDYQSLLAAEVLQLMCLLPRFSKYLHGDQGVIKLVQVATGDHKIHIDLAERLKKARMESPKDLAMKHAEIVSYVQIKVKNQLENLENKSTVMTDCDRILISTRALPMKKEFTPVFKADYLLRGLTPDDDPPIISSRAGSARNHPRFFRLGDILLVGPQTVGKVLSLPQPNMALVIINGVPMETGSVDTRIREADLHYGYVSLESMEWDSLDRMWKPKGTCGDRMTIKPKEKKPPAMDTLASTLQGIPRPLMHASKYAKKHQVIVPFDTGTGVGALDRPVSALPNNKPRHEISRRVRSAGEPRTTSVPPPQPTISTQAKNTEAIKNLDFSADAYLKTNQTQRQLFFSMQGDGLSPFKADAETAASAQKPLSKRVQLQDSSKTTPVLLYTPGLPRQRSPLKLDSVPKLNIKLSEHVEIDKPTYDANHEDIAAYKKYKDKHRLSQIDSIEKDPGSRPRLSSRAYYGSISVATSEDIPEQEEPAPRTAETRGSADQGVMLVQERHSDDTGDTGTGTGTGEFSLGTHDAALNQNALDSDGNKLGSPIILTSYTSTGERESNLDSLSSRPLESDFTGDGSVTVLLPSESGMQNFNLSASNRLRAKSQVSSPREPNKISSVLKGLATESNDDESSSEKIDHMLPDHHRSLTVFNFEGPKPQKGGRARPASAVEGFRKAGQPEYHSDFQRHRVNAWKQTTRPVSQPEKGLLSRLANTSPLPPQPPSSPLSVEVQLPSDQAPPLEPHSPRRHSPEDETSPDPEEKEEEGVRYSDSEGLCTVVSLKQPWSEELGGGFVPRKVPRANMWLGDGKDLFWEELKRRPKSGLMPGWQEGLPDKMMHQRQQNRAKSALARSTGHIPFARPHRAFTGHKKNILHVTSLYKQQDASKSPPPAQPPYNPQRGLYDEDPLPGPVEEDVYSPLVVWSYQKTPRHDWLSSDLCPTYLSGLYKTYLEELELDSGYSPTSNAPTPWPHRP